MLEEAYARRCKCPSVLQMAISFHLCISDRRRVVNITMYRSQRVPQYGHRHGSCDRHVFPLPAAENDEVITHIASSDDRVKCVLTYAFSPCRRSLLAHKEFNVDKITAMSLILHCCDISHPSKQFSLHSRWTALLIEEFFKQVSRREEL